MHNILLTNEPNNKIWNPGEIGGILLPIAIYVAWFSYDIQSPLNLLHENIEGPLSNIFTPYVNPPWRYRFFPNIVNWLWAEVARFLPFINHHDAMVWSHCAFMVAAIIAFHILLRRKLGISLKGSLLGTIGIAISYPYVFGFQPPVYMTLADPMSYLFIILGLVPRRRGG